MKLRSFIGIVGFLTAVSVASGETITAQSAPFSFPALTKAALHNQAAQFASFRCNHYSPTAGIFSIGWSIPDQLMAKNGTIKIYSVLGREVASFDVTAKSGIVNWHVARSVVPNGMYIARLTCGTFKSNIKLMLYK